MRVCHQLRSSVAKSKGVRVTEAAHHFFSAPKHSGSARLRLAKPCGGKSRPCRPVGGMSAQRNLMLSQVEPDPPACDGKSPILSSAHRAPRLAASHLCAFNQACQSSALLRPSGRSQGGAFRLAGGNSRTLILGPSEQRPTSSGSPRRIPQLNILQRRTGCRSFALGNFDYWAIAFRFDSSRHASCLVCGTEILRISHGISERIYYLIDACSQRGADHEHV